MKRNVKNIVKAAALLERLGINNKNLGSLLNQKAFTLLELLVSITILSLMMAFMFTLISQTVATWEIGNRRIEAAQAARVGLNAIARDLQFAYAGNFTVVSPDNLPNQINIIPVFARSNITTLSENVGRIIPATNSDQIFAITSHGDLGTTNSPFQEVGFQCVFVQSLTGNVSIAGGSYALVKHRVENVGSGTNTNAKFNAFLRTSTSTNWIITPGGAWIDQRQPIIDNCVRFKLSYAINSGSSIIFTNSWTNQTSLPLGVLAEVTVLDSKTMARIRRIKGPNPLTTAEIASITNTSAAPSTPEERLLREGSVTMRRLIPFLNSEP
jgi:prepilin-type N-terminal cleavage/methylation domain-containing protein